MSKSLPLILFVYTTFTLFAQNADTTQARIYLDSASILRDSQNYPKAIALTKTSISIYNDANLTDLKAKAFNHLSVFYVEMGQPDSSLVAAESALQLLLKNENSDPLDIGDIYLNIGFAYDNLQQYQAASQAYHKALFQKKKKLSENDLAIATIYQELGIFNYRLSKLDSATFYLLKALKIKEQIPEIDENEIASAHNNISVVYHNSGDVKNTTRHLSKALEIRERILEPHHPDLIISYTNLGGLFLSNGDFSKAIPQFEKVLEVRLEDKQVKSEDLANAYNNLGLAYHKLGQLKKAASYYENAYTVLKNEENNTLGFAITLNNLGSVLIDSREYQRAIDYLEKSLSIRLGLLGNAHRDVAISYNNLGNCYFGILEFQKSIDYHQKALTTWQKVFASDNPQIAYSYINLGTSHLALENFNESFYFYQKALAIRLANLAPNHPEIAFTYHSLGNYFEKVKDFEKAKSAHLKALNMRLNNLGEKHPEVAESYNKLAALEINFNRLEQARNYLSQSAQTLNYTYSQATDFEAISDWSALKENLVIKGKFYKAVFQKNPQKSQYLDSVNLNFDHLIQLQDHIETQLVNKSAIGLEHSKNYNIYEEAILFKVENDFINYQNLSPFVLAEKAKARLLKNNFNELDAKKIASIPDSLLRRESTLAIGISEMEKKIDLNITSDSLLNTYKEQLFSLKRQSEVLLNLYKKNYPEYFQLKFDFSAYSEKKVQQLLLPNQALLEYFVGDSTIFLFFVTQTNFQIKQIKNNFQLEKLVEQLQQGILENHIPPNQSTKEVYNSANQKYANAAYQLYEKLIAPIAEGLPKKLIIIPDGVLGYVPFDALLQEMPQQIDNPKKFNYLIRDYEISYAHSATLLAEMRKKNHQASKQLVAFGPEFKETSDTKSSLALYRQSISPLKHNIEEVHAIDSLMGATTFTHQAAMLSTFLENAPDYRLIHLSTHGKADDKGVNYAYLVFAAPEKDTIYEKLYLNDLYNLQLRADMVVLSACETGLGKLQKGEGILSLARGFAYAGAKSVIYTLWSVNDQQTSELMKNFYQNLKEGQSKAEALRNAKLYHLEKTNKADPFFWAAFVPVGDMTALNIEVSYLTWLLLTGILLFVSIFFLRKS